ncbi:MAG: manganese efflux pump MntP [Eubacteriales bacterium]
MSLFDLILTAVALSMDAFAVAVCRGLAMRRLRIGQAVIVGLYFGISQALMPVIGYFLGEGFEDKIKAYDHWIAFVLLALIGLKMIIEVLKSSKCAVTVELKDSSVSFRQMFPLAIATSIDALAVGVSFAFLGVDILPAASFIGIITFTLSFAGVGAGCFFGSRFQRPAQLSGGIILILMGVKILIEHLTGG